MELIQSEVFTNIVEYFTQRVITPATPWGTDVANNPVVEDFIHSYKLEGAIGDIASSINIKDRIYNQALNQDSVYYIKFRVQVKPNAKAKKINVILTNANDNAENLDDKNQFIASINVPQGKGGTTSTWANFDFVFTPYDNDLKLAWLLQRNNISEITAWTPNIEILQFKTLTNLLPSNGGQSCSITKIGLQGPTGMLFSLNGEQLRIGKNGIYELEENIDINFFGAVLSDNSYCIADFKYKKINTTDNTEGGE